MTEMAKPKPDNGGAEEKSGASEKTGAPSPRRIALPLPALAAIALYLVVRAAVWIFAVAEGHASLLYLFFSAAFLTAALGLLLLLRWAWAMTVAAVLLMACLFFSRLGTGQSLSNIVQGLLNLVFFLYLIRTEVREKLR